MDLMILNPLQSIKAQVVEAKIYKGQIFKYGVYTDPRDFLEKDTLEINEVIADQIIANYKDDILGAPIQVIYGSHDTDLRNAVGTITDIYKQGDGVWADHSITDPEVIAKLDSGEVGALSPMYNPEYESSRVEADGSRKNYGAVLRHIAIVDAGHFNDMENLVAAQKNKKTFDKNKMLVLSYKQDYKDIGESMDITKESIDNLTDEQLKVLGIERVKNEDETQEETSEDAPEDQEETVEETQEAEAVVAKSKELDSIKAEMLIDRKARHTAEVKASLTDLKAKFNVTQIKQVQASMTELNAQTSIEAVETCRKAVDAVVVAVAAGPDIVQMGELGSAVGKDVRDMSDSEAKEVAAISGSKPEDVKKRAEKYPRKESN